MDKTEGSAEAVSDGRPRSIRIGQLFTKQELDKVQEIYRSADFSAKRLCEEVTKPALARINSITGQENDPMYLAYALEYACGQATAVVKSKPH